MATRSEEQLTLLASSSPVLAEASALLAKTSQASGNQFTDHIAVTANAAPDLAVLAPDVAVGA